MYPYIPVCFAEVFMNHSWVFRVEQFCQICHSMIRTSTLCYCIEVKKVLVKGEVGNFEWSLSVTFQLREFKKKKKKFMADLTESLFENPWI